MSEKQEPPRFRLVTKQQLASGYVLGPFARHDGYRKFTVLEEYDDGTAKVLNPEWELWKASSPVNTTPISESDDDSEHPRP
jgi:hypothetical protein